MSGKPTGAEKAIAISDLSVDYPRHGPGAVHHALRGITLDVAQGEILGLMGESGSGKSTLGRTLAGRMAVAGTGGTVPHISGGDAVVLGHSLRHIHRKSVAQLTFHVGILEQDAAATLLPTLTVLELVAAPIFERDKHYSVGDAGARVATLIDLVHLPLSILGKYPFELSSGQRQRVALARALVLGPAILIADEPTAGIDATVRDAVIDIFAQLSADPEFTAVIISHDLSVLRKSTSRTAVLHEGRLVGLAPINGLLASPQHPFIADLATALTKMRL